MVTDQDAFADLPASLSDFFLLNFSFLPRNVERDNATVCRLSVCPSVTFRYRDHTGRNTSKIISRPNSLRYLLILTPTRVIWCNGNTPKLGWNRGGVMSTKACNISETMQDRTKVTMTD